jgi:hypothetical protein
MITNIGDTDRIIRFVIGAALILAALAGSVGLWGFVVGIALVATAYKRFCPAYKFFNHTTATPTP